jgi:putative transposase
MTIIQAMRQCPATILHCKTAVFYGRRRQGRSSAGAMRTRLRRVAVPGEQSAGANDSSAVPALIRLLLRHLGQRKAVSAWERPERRPACFPHILALTSSMRRRVPVLANPLRHLRRRDRPVRRSAFVSLRYCLMSSYPNSHHRRLEGYDYTAAGFYFVTLCIQDRLPLLGRVNGGEQLSPAGELVELVCGQVMGRCPDIDLDTLAVMPDDLHAILSLSGEGRSLSSLIHAIKKHTTAGYAHEVSRSSWARFNGRLWQRRFHDRIIRDDEELRVKREYTIQNPLRWSLKEAGL